jgi:hypothetical protein
MRIFLSYLFLYAKVHVVGPYGYDGAYGYGAYGYDFTFVIDFTFFFWQTRTENLKRISGGPQTNRYQTAMCGRGCRLTQAMRMRNKHEYMYTHTHTHTHTYTHTHTHTLKNMSWLPEGLDSGYADWH